MADAREDSGIPAVHVLQLVDIVARWGVTRDELFEGIPVEDLSDPSARLAIPVLEQIARRAYALTGEPALGVYLGLQMRASAHGYLGFAAMTSSTIREALELAMKFAPTRTSAIGIRLHVDRDVSALIIEELVPLGAARELIVFAMMVGFVQMAAALTGLELEGSADIAVSRPANFERFEGILKGPVRFDQPVNQLLFRASDLERPIVLADPVARKLAQEQCERELDALGRQHQASLLERVRTLLAKSDGFHSLDEVAALSGMSTRTLKRRLAALGTAFSTVLEDEQRKRALILLRSEELSIDQIAGRVGYTEVANFTRAFRRWTGMTPAAYRKQPPS